MKSRPVIFDQFRLSGCRDEPTESTKKYAKQPHSFFFFLNPLRHTLDQHILLKGYLKAQYFVSEVCVIRFLINLSCPGHSWHSVASA